MPVIDIMPDLVRGEVISNREVLDTRLNRLMATGTLFDLHIGKRSWSIRPNPEDFGLKEFPAIFRPGSMIMLPSDVLNKIDLIEGRSRRFLDLNSFHFGESKRSGFRFVHTRKIGDVCMDLDKFRDEFFAAMENLIEGYDESQASMRGIYFKHWEDLKTKNPGMLMVQENYSRREALWDKLAKSYPPVSDIRKYYKFNFSMRQMAFPESLESVDFRTLLQDQEHSEEYFKKLDQMVERGKEQIEHEVTEFVSTTFRGLRTQVVEVFQDMLKKVEEGEPLNKKNITSVRQVMAHVNELDFLNDTAFKEQLERVSEALGGKEEYNDDMDAAKALASVLTETVNFVTKTTDTSAMEAAEKFFSRSLDLS